MSLQRAGRSTFEPARQRQPLFDGDFVKAGKTGSAEIMFYDGTLYTIRPGLALRVPASGLLRGRGQPDQDDLGRGQRLHVRIDLDRRDRRGDRGDRPGLARVGRRGAGRQDRSHELPRPHDRFDRQGDRRPGGRGADLPRRRRPAPSRPRSAFPTRPQPTLPADNRIYDLKTGDQVELKWSKVAEAPRATACRSPARASSCPDSTEVDLDDRVQTSARVKVSRGGLLLLARRGDRRRAA